MPTVVRIKNKKLYKNKDLNKTLNDIDLTFHMGPHENGNENV